MPRAPVAGREIRRRSRNGCWNCKARKVKCGEEKPRCSNCERLEEDCDYKIRLSWGGRPLKKKQMLNGEEQTEDESMFLPGAGQFSIHQQFPQTQTFVSQTVTNGGAPSRKPPVMRPGKKSGGISSYQNVFSITEPSVPGPSTPTSASPEEHPQGSSQSSSSPPPRAGSHPYYPWTSDPDHSQTNSPTPASTYATTPVSATFQQEPFEPESVFTDRSRFTPQFPPITASYIPSPTFPKLNLQSPISPTYAQHHHGLISPTHPQVHSTQPKVFHPPPGPLASPTKRIRRSASPPSLPAPHQVFYQDNYQNSAMHPATSHAPSVNAGFEFVSTPFHPVAIADTAHEYGLELPSINTPVVNDHRLSLANILAPVPQEPSYSYNSRVTDNASNSLDYSNSLVTYGVANGDSSLEDDDVEEIPRYNFNNNGFGDAFRYRMTAASNYYPRTISIPRSLDPLPALLVENEKNMMYFKHFLSFTARLLVPHDCSENPFKKVLPQMAVSTDKLMNLLLAYSASHRARLLNMPEPTDRINEFLQETIKDLNISLNDDDEKKSDSTLATLIMLCSYDIISPNKLISWRRHLNAAREIILSRGETAGIHCRDKVSYFLVRWFAYLDVLGSLSGRDNDQPLFSGRYWINEDADENEDSAVDCVLGFTSKCVSILAKIGELARRSDQEKKAYLEQFSHGPILSPAEAQEIVKNWKPPADIEEQAKKLEEELEYARNQAGEVATGQFTCESAQASHKHGHHHHRHAPHSHHKFVEGDPNDEMDNEELLATNDAFHLAASVHLYRRVLNYPSAHPKVQRAVALIVGAMHKVRHNGAAENCLLFPLFTAGCEAIQNVHRTYTLRRMQAVEKIGMTQVTAARRLMERVWEEGLPWETLSDGEFIG
ncbi:fungal-specific transcription factor domain-containing protein [Kalaharituber pfeilii]|nr:fungal-specific transcription factor domain-containing protein [Kalaharituber pfeilii]